MKKRIVSLCLVLAMVIGMLPVTVFATGTGTDPVTATYDAAVATAVTIDGTLDEINWLTGGKLSGGQAFDILWDGGNLYFAVVAGESDTALTVKVGDTTLANAEKAEGAAAFEVKVPHSNYGIEVLENVTLTVGESTWTGNVNLVKYARTAQVTPPSLGGDTTPAAYGNGWTFSIPAAAEDTSNDYRSYALKTGESTLAQRGNGIRFEFDFDPTGMTAHSGAAQSASAWTANAGFNSVLIGPNKERIVFGIDNIEGTGLMFIIQTATWGQRTTYDLGRTAEDGVFHFGLEWTADGIVNIFVNGCYLTSFEGKEFVHSSETTSNALIVEARRHRAYNATPVEFKVFNMVLSLPAEVTYKTEGTYDAFVASEITLDGAMDELDWRAGAELGGGQPFDILFDGNNLYFGVQASEADTELTVQIGDETVATATKASGASAIEAKAEYLTKDINVIEDVTITVGDSVWTGTVNLIKMARVEDILFSNLTDKGAQVGANASAASVTATADGKGIVFDLPAVDAANQTVDTLYAYKRTTTGLVGRSTDVAFEFTMDPVAFTNISDRTGTVGANNAVWAGFELILHDDAGQGIRFGIGNAGEMGLFLNCVNKATVKGTLYLGKSVGDDPFDVKVLWKTDKSIEVFVDGVSVGTVANAEAALADLSSGYNGTNNVVHLRATRYDYQYEYYKEDVEFTLSNIKLSKVVEVTYITDETLEDGQLESLFVDAEPTAASSNWDSANWENFANISGKVAALVYDTHVYLAVKDAGTGIVSATLGTETKTATLADGAAVLCFDATAVTEYGQALDLQVSVDGTNAWTDGGKLTVAAKVLNKANSMPTNDLVNGRVSVSGDTITTTATDSVNNSSCAYIIQRKDLTALADIDSDVLFEQTITVESMSYGEASGTFPGGPVNNNGYTIMLEYGISASASKTYSGVVAPDAEGNLSFYAYCADASVASVALGKEIGDTFKLGLLWGADSTTTVYVDGVALGTIANAACTDKIYSSGAGTVNMLLKYQDAACSADDPTKIVASRPTLAILGSQTELGPVEDEITQEAIFGTLDLEAASANLPLVTSFETAYLGTKTLRWTSSDEEVVETDGTIHPNLTTNKKAILSVFLDGSETALWSVEVTVPASSSALNALLSQETITVDGNLSEVAWVNWKRFTNPDGNIAAAWTRGYVYFAAHSAEADTLKLTINGKEITVDLAAAAITGAEGALIAKNAKTGVVEIGIPLTAINFNLTDYNQSVLFNAKLVTDSADAELDALLLVFTGDIAEVQALSSYTKDNGPWTLLTDNITYNGTEPGKVNYVYKTNTNLDHTELIVFSNDFQFDALPITTGAMIEASAQADGFYYYFSDEDSSTRKGTTICASIFTTDGETLKLRIGQGQGLEGYVFELNKTLGEKFRITYYWYANNDLEIYVDGVLMGTVANAGYATSYLGVDVITYRYYSEKVSAAKVKFTLDNQVFIKTAYETVLDELTPNAVFGRIDLDHVQKDLPMVTSFASANFEALNLEWTTSDESVVTTDGKITRHETEAKSAVVTVYFIDDENNKIELWSVDVTVDPMSVTKQAAPAIIHTGFAAPGSITVDGTVADTETWLLNGWVLSDKEQAVGYFGAQWDQENLYILLDTEAENVALNVGGKDITVTKTGNVTELEIPVADLGKAKIEEYGVTLDIVVTMDGSTYTGKLNLTNVDWWATDNTYAGLPMLANNVKSVRFGTSDTPDGNQGAKQLENGWHLYDLYDAEGTNPAGIRTYVLFMKMPVYENFADRTEATHVEFDFDAKALPEWEWDEGIKDEIGRAFANYGVTFSLSDKADSGKNSNVAVFGIVNTADGLYLVVNRGTDDYDGYPLNKQVGEEFRIGLTWLTNANLILSIDGEEITTIQDMSKFVNSVGDTSFVVNMLRNKVKPTSEADNMDVYLTNIAFGKAHSTENIIRNLTFDDFCGENESETEILYDLELPAFMTNGQLDTGYPISWMSSDGDTINATTGEVTRPEHGVKVVTLTATLDNNGTIETKEFSLIVYGLTISNGNVLVISDDTNPFGKAAYEYNGLLFNLDMTNNSVVYAFPEGEVEKINLITLTDLDEISRLNRESLRLFVSNDNVTYTEIDTYKLHHDGTKWYLYNFEAEARYIKVHYTHRDRDDTDFINTPGEMISVSWDESLAVPADAASVAVPATSLLDEAVAVKLPAGITTEGLRISLNGEILFHYVDKSGNVIVRIPDPTSGSLKVWNAEGIELADKENVYEVTYGTRETLPASGRWVLGMKAGQTFPDGSSLAVDTLYHMSGKSVSASTDGGYTWSSVGSISFATGLSSGGWGIDSKTGRLFHEFYDSTVTFVNSDVSQSKCNTYVFYSDDGGKSWTQASGLGKVEGDLQSNYVLSYTDITELAGNDGEGPNVDFVFPMGAQYNNNGAFCGRVAYTTDGGKTWHYSESKITYGNETAFEGGVSEATILEREDGTLVYYARCQSSGVDNFTISYSLDHGVTWLTPGLTSSIYTTNTQALMMTYDFDGFDGNRLTGTPMFMWGGNNVLGGSSYMRMPMNFAISTNEMDTFRQIQNIFSETFMDTFTNEADHYITNPSVQQINGDDMYLTFTRLYHKDSVYVVVNDFTDWFVRTKGAYDSFEHGTAQYEGWVLAKGTAEATKDKASVGTYSMRVKENTQVTRSVPYLQNGTVSIDLFVEAGSKFVLELQPAFSNKQEKCAVISAEIAGTTMTLADGTKLTLTEGWNTVVFDLTLTDDMASVSVNGGDAKAVTVNAEAGDWVSYITILASSTIYVDELLIISELDAVVELTEAEKAEAEAVVEKIKAIGDVTMMSADSIAIARYAYDQLTQAQKDLVDRRVPSGTTDKVNEEGSLINYYEVLIAAEETYKTLYTGATDTEKLELLWTLVQKYYDDAYAYAYEYADQEGYLDTAVGYIQLAIDELVKAETWLNENETQMTPEFKEELLDSIKQTIETLEETKTLIEKADVLDQESLDALLAALTEAGEAGWEMLCALEQAGVDTNNLVIIPALKEAHRILVEEVIPYVTEKLTEAVKAGTAWLMEKIGEAYDEALAALIAALPDIDAWLYDWFYNNPEKVIAFFSEYGDEIIELLDTNKEALCAILGYIAANYGDDVMDYVMENPEKVLETMIQWYNTYGYRVWPMIDVYLEALGIYDSAEEALNKLAELLKQTGIDVVEELEALVNALVEKAEAALEELKAQLENASGELAEEIKAKIAKIEAAIAELEEIIEKLAEEGIGAVDELKAIAEELEAILKELYIDATTDEYAVKSDSWYTAIGDDTAASESYVDYLAEDLNLGERYTNLAEAGQTILDAYDVITANKDTIAKSDLITVGYGVNGFNTFVKNQILSGDTMDWATVTGEESVEYIDAALAELKAYFVEQGLDKDIQIPMIGTRNLADTLTLAVEAYAYAYIEYVTNYPEVINAIHEISPEALVIIVGMYNPLEGVVIEGIDLGEYLGCIVDATNAHSLAYAMLTENVIYVDAPEVETKKTASEMTAEALILEMMTGFKNLVPSENGHEYIKTQILNALDITGLLGDANSDGKVNNVDAMLVLQYYAGLGVEINTAVCDVDGNGKINNVDAMLILQYYAQIITVFPVEA